MPQFTPEGKIKKSDAPQNEEKKPDFSALERMERENVEPKTVDQLPLYKVYAPLQENKMIVCGGIKPLPARVEEQDRAKAQQEKIAYESWKYKGNLFNTYLIYETGDDVYFIDQHAAHERLIFDSLIEKLKNRQSIARQGMLVPYILDLNAAEASFISDNLMLIRSMGFDIEPFGMTAFRINEVPLDLQDIDIKAFFGELLSDLDGLRAIKLEDVLRDKIAMTACKHAIKGGMELTDAEKQRLIEMIKGDVGLKCPHGRPVCVKMTKSQIEKMFKRIV